MSLEKNYTMVAGQQLSVGDIKAILLQTNRRAQMTEVMDTGEIGDMVDDPRYDYWPFGT